MAISRALRAKLERAAEEQTLIRVARKLKFATGYLEGYVLHVGLGWAVLAKVVDGGWFDGQVAFRLKDVSAVKKHKGISASFSKTRPEWPPSSPFGGATFDDVEQVLDAFGADGNMFGIEKEAERKALWIGVLDEVWPKWLWLQEVDFTGRWKTKPLGYKLNAITTVSSGNRYMHALREVAGPPPTIRISPDSPISEAT
jgi:hypothetical protein